MDAQEGISHFELTDRFAENLELNLWEQFAQLVGRFHKLSHPEEAKALEVLSTNHSCSGERLKTRDVAMSNKCGTTSETDYDRRWACSHNDRILH